MPSRLRLSSRRNWRQPQATSVLEHRRWKYAVLNLQAGVELLLKARLAQEHWSLIFANVDKATGAALVSGDVPSVTPETAIKRLEDIAQVSLGDAFEPDRPLDKLRKLRNRLQHFQFDLEIEAVVSLAAETLGWALDFYGEQFASAPTDPDFDATADAAAERLRGRLREFRQFVHLRMQAIESELRRATPHPWDCPLCQQRALIVEIGRDPHCVFCRHQEDPVTLAQHMGEGGVEDDACLHCGAFTLGFVVFNNDEGAFRCATCGQQEQGCLSCFRHFIGSGDYLR